MAITAEQRQLRQKYIGSSDAAAIMGLDPHRSAADVWLEKTGQADGFDGNHATEAGNALERIVLNWAKDKVPAMFWADVMKVAPDTMRAANFDGIVPDWQPSEKFVVEAKTTGILGFPDGAYGEAETDQVPERVIVQVHHQMEIAGPEYRVAFVPVLVGGRGFSLYRVPRNDALADAIAEQCRDFMEKYVRLGVQPDDFKPSMDVLKRVRREPNKVVPVAGELVDAWVVARAAAKRANEDEEDAKRAVIAALGDAEGGDCGDGRKVTFLETTRKGYTVKDSTFRTLRVKAAKEKAQ